MEPVGFSEEFERWGASSFSLAVDEGRSFAKGELGAVGFAAARYSSVVHDDVSIVRARRACGTAIWRG